MPGCPNWDVPAQPNYQNAQITGFGCSVNGNLAAMVANPQDLVHGRDGGGVGDSDTAAKAIDTYRKKAPTGAGALQAVSSKGD